MRKSIYHTDCAAALLLALTLLPSCVTENEQSDSLHIPPATSPSTRATTRPTTVPAFTRWDKEMKFLAAADLKNPPPTGAVLFTGSSTIRKWTTLQKDFSGIPVVNHGFGGSWLPDATYFADKLIFPFKPRAIVLYSGGNDINAGRSPEQVFNDFKAFVEKVRATLPTTPIIYLAIAPTLKRWTQNDRIRHANQLIRDYAAGHDNLKYIEVWDELLGPDGTPRTELLLADKLHPSAAGYKIRAQILRPMLEQILLTSTAMKSVGTQANGEHAIQTGGLLKPH